MLHSHFAHAISVYDKLHFDLLKIKVLPTTGSLFAMQVMSEQTIETSNATVTERGCVSLYFKLNFNSSY